MTGRDAAIGGVLVLMGGALVWISVGQKAPAPPPQPLPPQPLPVGTGPIVDPHETPNPVPAAPAWAGVVGALLPLLGQGSVGPGSGDQTTIPPIPTNPPLAPPAPQSTPPPGAGKTPTPPAGSGLDTQSMQALKDYPDLQLIVPVLQRSVTSFAGQLQAYQGAIQQAIGRNQVWVAEHPRGGMPGWLGNFVSVATAVVAAVASLIPGAGPVIAAAVAAGGGAAVKEVNSAQAVAVAQSLDNVVQDYKDAVPYSYRGFSDIGFIPQYAAKLGDSLSDWMSLKIEGATYTDKDGNVHDAFGWNGAYVWLTAPMWGALAINGFGRVQSSEFVTIAGKPYSHRAQFTAYIDDLLNRVGQKLIKLTGQTHMYQLFPVYLETLAVPFADRDFERQTGKPVPAAYMPGPFEDWLKS